MPLSSILEALGGLGLFILGMKSMSDGLQKLAGERLRRSIEKITGNRLTAALMGSCLASLLQSSSAASILVIGFVNAGLISLYQALAVLLGTGIGTTLAIQLIAFKITHFALPAIFLGVSLKFFGKRRRWVYAGNLLLGAGLVFLGLQIMESGFAPLQNNAIFQWIHGRFFSWRISSVLLGALLTFFVQSGSAAIGIVLALAGSGLFGFEAAVAMIIGEVLGASSIAAIAAINGTLAAKRAALLYFLINVFAVSMALLFFPLFLKLVLLLSPGVADYAMTGINPYIARHLANAHTVFSLLNLLLFLPLIGFFARSAVVIMPGRAVGGDIEPRSKFIDTRVVNTPTIALLQARNEILRMADILRTMFDEVVEQFHRFDAKKALRIKQKEEVLDVLQRDIAGFLVLLSRQPLTAETSLGIPIMLQTVSTLERMGDQSEAILDYLRLKKENKLIFSPAAMAELRSLGSKVALILHLAVDSLDDPSKSTLDTARSLNNTVLQMKESIQSNHMKRLTGGKCTVAAALVYSDIVAAFWRISDYALTIMETEGELG
jgi:phosphate:Na+ symporter